jgi:S1-C subfamily serine protease
MLTKRVPQRSRTEKTPGPEPVTFWLLMGLGLLMILGAVWWSNSGGADTDTTMPRFGEDAGHESSPPAPSGGGYSLDRCVKAVVLLQCTSPGSRHGSEGTGFFYSSEGCVLTNCHVVEGFSTIRAYYDGKFHDAEVVKQDSDLDLAVVRVQGDVPEVIALGDSGNTHQGDDVVAIGFPLGSELGTEPTATSGTVSSIRVDGDESVIQTDAAINPGNSGGPLVDKHSGSVIGIVTAKISNADQIGFAIPINVAKELVKDCQ